MAIRRVKRLQTLQARFLLALALIGILPLALVGLGMATLDRRALAEQSAQELTGLARGLAGQLEVYLSSLLHGTRAIAALPEIVSMELGRQEELLKELFHQYPEFSRLSTFDRTGQRLASSHLGPAFSIAARPSFQTAGGRGHQAWEVGSGILSGRLSLFINTPLRDAECRVVGVLGAVVDLENLSAVIGRVAVGAGGHAFVLDGAGRVLLHPDRAVAQERPDYSWLAVPSGGRPAAPGTVRYALEGKALVAGYAPVPNMGWTVVAERPEAEVLARPGARGSWRLGAWRQAVRLPS